MRVTLNDVEQEFCIRVAALRFASNRSAGVKNAKIGPQSNFLTDVIGLGGELSVARAFNVYPDLTVSPRAGGVDLISKTKKKVDVKTTAMAQGHLLVRPHSKDNDVDIYVLVIADFPTFDIVGWAERERLFDDKYLTNLGRGVTYAMPQSELNKL